MNEDEDRPALPATVPLDRLGVAELRAYIDRLRSEIARAEAQIAAKDGHRTAADTLFTFS